MSQSAMQQALSALKALRGHFPTDVDMVEAGYNEREVDEACTAFENAQSAIAALEKELALHTAETIPPDPCPGCKRGAVCRTPMCGRIRSSELLRLYGTAGGAEDAEMPRHWTSADGQQHWVTTDHALEILRWFYDEWPGGFEEIEACSRTRSAIESNDAKDWTDDAACLSGLADSLEQESADESERGNDSAACAWSCRAHELRQIVSRMVRSCDAAGVIKANDAKDAARYRWLRDDPRGRALSMSAIEWSGEPEEADAAIDAAMSTHQPKESGNGH